MTSLVIFDCDGVLVDSERLSHIVLQQMLEELGAPLSFDEAVQRFMGTSMPVCMERIGELLGAPPPADFLPQFSQRTRAAFETGLTAVPGVEQVLDGLQTPFCVASNGNRAKVDFTLGHTGLLPRFEGRIFTADDVRHPKPAPDLFLLAARTLDADPLRTTVVEDTPTGIRAAKAAGMRAIGFSAMTSAERLLAAGADAVARTMAEVQVLLPALPQRALR
ncbi:HAD family hydrolase [Roseateles toxinivorans]|uniref:HAD superfamily hydrolase (TIGR01509 family) n=1 Tax=Roseateles toxinivorans TaxID=270368 RepID=A0A4R6QQW4_9BURK|nr:HAD family hydrolase [Roseateles toxinivorans]TDP72545.1 HAD superfamily hydrolase (TIGR01509 family) [Roseateles toxinivorans]